ncbi:MAG: ROK family protein [Clostridium sp.]|uniref:Beta-glucoside kinase n=1 Tax=Clostridium paraputrificum TaxID=29363 RepID=A0A6N3CY04_9CLOT|nr:ROK family protein [Clostridium sp.]MBS5926419.1 ROK family protein [Clostridium sp.]MBS5987547.1 ROK family protein [Clostridium sp.]
MKDVLAIDIGGTEIKVGLISNNSNLYNKKSYRTRVDGVSLKDRVVSILRENITSDIGGIAVSTAGQVDSSSGLVIDAIGESFVGWKGTNVKELIMEEFNLPSVVENDANCAAIAEGVSGAGRNIKNFVLITIGTGIGGGVFVDGKLLKGAGGIAGELGHLLIDIRQEDGSRKIEKWEKYASTTSLVNRIKDSLNLKDEIDGRWVFNELKKGNKEVKAKYYEWIYDLSLGITTLIHIFNPEMIIIGGGISAQGNILIEPIDKHIKELAMKAFTENLKVVATKQNNDAALWGAYFLSEIRSF